MQSNYNKVNKYAQAQINQYSVKRHVIDHRIQES